MEVKIDKELVDTDCWLASLSITFDFPNSTPWKVRPTTIESACSPGLEESFVPVFQPGQPIRDKCVKSFVPIAIESRQMYFLIKKSASARPPLSPLPLTGSGPVPAAARRTWPRRPPGSGQAIHAASIPSHSPHIPTRSVGKSFEE